MESDLDVLNSTKDGRRLANTSRLGVESGVLRKRPANCASTNPSSSSNDNHDPSQKRRRKRQRTTGFRKYCCEQIDRALRSNPCPIAHLFSSLDDDGVPQAPVSLVVSQLGVSQSHFSDLSPAAVIAIAHLSDVFTIEDDAGKLMLKYPQASWDVEACTVYLDNLPATASASTIRRMCGKFGTVVEARVPRGPAPPGPPGLRKPRPRSFAFVQFTASDAVDKMVEAWSCSSRKSSRIKLWKRATPAERRQALRQKRIRKILIKKEKMIRKRTLVEQLMAQQLSRSREEIEEMELDGAERAHNGDTGLKELADQITDDQLLYKKDRRTPRKRKSRKRAKLDGVFDGSLDKYFAGLQVYPFKQYVTLRRDYRRLRQKSGKLARRRLGDKAAGKNVTLAWEAARDAEWSTTRADDE